MELDEAKNEIRSKEMRIRHILKLKLWWFQLMKRWKLPSLWSSNKLVQDLYWIRLLYWEAFFVYLYRINLIIFDHKPSWLESYHFKIFFFFLLSTQIYAQELLPLLKIITKQIIRATIKHGMWLKVAMTRCILLTIIIYCVDGVKWEKIFA
jgi:hypothetical protein